MIASCKTTLCTARVEDQFGWLAVGNGPVADWHLVHVLSASLAGGQPHFLRPKKAAPPCGAANHGTWSYLGRHRVI